MYFLFTDVYGSLAWSEYFTPYSDIALLVEGFTSKELYWRMWSEVEAITAPFPPSIVLAEDAVPATRIRGAYLSMDNIIKPAKYQDTKAKGIVPDNIGNISHT